MTPVELLESVAAGAAGGAGFLAILKWMFDGHFDEWVLASLRKRGQDVKKEIDKLYEPSIEERNRWFEEIRRNAHSINGLVETSVRHDKQLAELQKIPWLMEQQLQGMEEVKNQLRENAKEVGDHATQLAVLIERRNTPRGG